jgi:hypothetical protein
VTSALGRYGGIRPPSQLLTCCRHSEVILRPNLTGSKLDNCLEIHLSPTSGPRSGGLTPGKSCGLSDEFLLVLKY